MAILKLKKGYNLDLAGQIADNEIVEAPVSTTCAITPDDFCGIVPRLDKKKGETVVAGEAIYHDKMHEAIKIVSPVSGIIVAVNRGERRKIESIVIERDGEDKHKTFDLKAPIQDVLLESGLWAMMRQRPYDIVPSPEVKPRDIFVTCFDSAPLAPNLGVVLGEARQYITKGVEVLKSLTQGEVYLSCNANDVIEVPGAVTNIIDGPHPAGNVGVQIANIKPVNKGEVVWTLDVVTLSRIGELFITGKVNFDTTVAVVGASIAQPRYVKATMGCPIATLTQGNINDSQQEKRYINGNALSGYRTGAEGYLRAPYRQVTVIPEIIKKDEFMGWASLSPKKFSIYRCFTNWLLGSKKSLNLDAKLNGGERAIVLSGEYDRMLPMDIYAEFLITSIIAFDIDKMEQLGIYEVAPEDFALAEYADTSKLELQRIVREGLDKMRKEVE